MFRRLALVSCLWSAALGLTACASPPPLVAAAPLELFDDARFAPPRRPVDVDAVFALDDEMRAYLRDEIEPQSRSVGPRKALIDALHKKGRLQLDYEATLTRNAAEAFESRTGNCLSLVIMTGALAREMGMEVTFQTVGTDEIWSKAGDMYFLSGHVNVMLGHRMGESVKLMDSTANMTVDFLAPEDTAGQRVHSISQATILAMYMNNRAAESLIRGQVDDAYWFARQAVVLDPSFLSAYNTLGVVYLRHANPARAAQALQFVSQKQPDNPRVLANLAESLRETGQVAEAATVQARLARLEPYPPFHFFNLGQLALNRGDNLAARDLFAREVARAPDSHEFHFWLAVADVRLARYDEAAKELKLALEGSVKRTDHDLYAAKLDHIQALASRRPAL